MNPFFFVRDCCSRALERKRTLIVLAVLLAVGFILGACFAKNPAMYAFNRRMCTRFVDRVCYSDTSVLKLFLLRTLGHSALILAAIAGGVHPVALALPVVALLFRSFTFGGSVVVLVSVYGAAGVLILVVLLLPVHLLIDALLLLSSSLSFGRAFGFCFCKRDFIALFSDFFSLVLCTAAVCLLEAFLLLAFFHPIGNIL